MPNSIRKKLQLYRNDTIYTPTEGMSALDSAKAGLSNMALEDGEIVIGRYQETNEDVKTVIGVVHDISNDEGITFFVSSDDLSSMYVRKPDVLYETDGTTGLLGLNQSELGYSWQLQGYDFTPYKYLRCYFKMADFSLTNAALTPSMVIELPLDTASLSKSAGDSTQEDPKTPCNMYIAGGVVSNPSDPTSVFTVLVAVDSTKTKFQVVNEISYDEFQYDDNYSNTVTNRNNNGRYLYKIEGCYDTLNSASTSEFVEHDPVFTASPAYGITSADIDNWNSMVGGGGITGIRMNGQTVGTSGIVDLGTVVTSESDPTISSWAKASTKPSYTASEVGAVPTTRTVNGKELSSDISLTSTDVGAVPRSRTVNGKALTGNITLTAEDVGALPSSTVIPTKVSELTNDSGFTTNTGTITGITMNGASKGTSGVVDLGTIVTAETDPTVPSWAKASTKPTYTANEVGALPDTTVIPTKVSQLTNDSGFTTNTGTITGITMNGSSKGTSGVVNLGTVVTTETDPTVPSWAKASTKPSYTASEVGALPDTTVIPTKVSDLTNDSGFTTNTGTITGITMNGASKGTSGVVDLGTVLTSHQDISGKADKSAAIGSLSLALDSTNYKITLSGTKVDGTSFTVSNVIDLPLESVVVNGSYDNTTKKVVLTLQNGSNVEFSVADLVAGLQSEITSTNKLSADLISDGNTNKVVTSTEKNSWNNAVSNSHTHSNKTVLDGITSTDITNWNSKTDNVGTVTGVKLNNTTKNPTDGVVDLGTVITSETQLSKGTTTGNGNAVTDITVSNHQITLTKGSTFLTSHQSIKTINGNSLVGTGDVTIIAVPSFTSADNGKILGVVNGQLAWVTPTTIYTGSGAPSSSQGNDGDIYLQTN